jgi:hypothetical protein
VNLAQRRLFLRDLLYRGNKTTSNTVYFVKEASFVNAASPQGGEGSLKAETTNTFTTTSLPVQTISHWLNISRRPLMMRPRSPITSEPSFSTGFDLRKNSRF